MKHPSSEKPRCSGKTKRGPCQNFPIHGATVCRTHGGAIKRVREAAARRVAEEKIQGKLARLVERGALIDNPLLELQKLATEAVLWKDVMAGEVAKLKEYRYQDHKGAEQLHSAVVVFERALDRCNTILATIAKLNIDERLTAVTEARAERVLAAIDTALRFAGVAPEQIEPAKAQAARHLRSTA